MRKIGYAMLLALLVNLSLAAAALARPVFLADGAVIEAQSVWRDEGMIDVLVNRDTLVRFYPHEVDLEKTFDKKWNRPAAKRGKRISKLAPMANAAAPSAVAAPQPSSAPPTASAAPQPAAKAEPPAAEPAEAVASAPAPPAAAVKPRAVIPPSPPSEGGMEGDLMTALPALVGLVAFALLLLASFWTVFVKAGEAGWKSLIPIYNLVVLLRIARCPLWWFLLFLVPVVNIIALVLMHIRLAKQFGRGALYGLALCFLGIIFFPLLAFGKARYASNGPQEFAFEMV